MLERFNREAMAPKTSDATPEESCAVGRILLGKRAFVVVPAARLPGGPHSGESCRFDVCGESLVVLEVDQPGAAEDLTGRLTGRELEIAILVAQGHATKVIAYRLGISEWTVATYLRRIFAKLGVESRAAMVYRCASLIHASLAPAAGRGGRGK
jgi:DNA-binding CsgD family transcriptional regulator